MTAGAAECNSSTPAPALKSLKIEAIIPKAFPAEGEVKKIQPATTMWKVSTQESNLVAGLIPAPVLCDPGTNASQALCNASEKPCSRPQMANVRPTPCQRPPRNIVTIRLIYVRTLPFRLPPSGM